MAVTTTFKQECPTCGATVKIDEKMIGKKVECTKCKDKFIAERPDDDQEDPPRGKQKAGANGKKPAKAGEEADEEGAEPVQVKSGKAKSPKHAVEDEAEPKAKAKKSGGANKLTIGLALAVVGVLVLGVAAFFLLKGRRPPDPARGSGPMTPGKKDEEPEKKGGVTPGETPKIETSIVPLNDAELAKLSNLLPNDTEYVFHLFVRDLFGPAGSLHEAVFKTPGALDNATMTRKLGFSPASVDDAIRAERYTAPSWKYAVIHFKEPLDEGQLKTALKLRSAGAPIDGQTYYKMTEPHPVFDVLGRISIGIPNWYRLLEPRRPEQPTFLRIYNAQTLIVGDQAPVVELLKGNGQFPLLSARSAPLPNPAPDSTAPKTDTPTPEPKPGPDSKTGPKTMPMPKMLAPPGMKGKANLPPPKSSQSVPFRSTPDPGRTSPFQFDAGLASVAGYEQGPAPQSDSHLIAKLPGTSWKGLEKAPNKFLYVIFADKGECRIGSEFFNAIDVPGTWQVDGKGMIALSSAKLPGVAYQFNLIAKGQMKGEGRDSDGRGWEIFLTQMGGPSITPQPPAAKNPNPGASPALEPIPGVSHGPMLTYEDRYLTIPPALKAVLDRMESRTPEDPEKVLLSSSTHMEASRLETSLPEFRDRVVRRPRQFWDITVLLNETTPRIRTLGVGLVQRGDTQRYQLRNEIACGQDSEAAAIKKEIVETTSFTIAHFLRKLVNHEVRLPELPGKEPKKAPPPDPKEKKAAKKPAAINASQMTVNQQGSAVEFRLDLVLDNATLTQVNSIAALSAGALRVEMEAAGSASLRHWLGKAGKTVPEKGLSDRDVPPGRFPPGAFLRAKTPFLVDQEPRNRISWMASLLPYMGQQHLYNRLQFDQSWRDPTNWMAGNTIVPQFLDPSYPDYLRRVSIDGMPLDLGATHYVGVAGIGLDAGSYGRNDPTTAHKRGIFSNDGSASIDEIQKGRGLSNTMMMIQIPHDGVTGVSPWIAGGGATLRGVPEKNSIAPFVLSRDKNDKPIEYRAKRGTFVLMADGSVRFVDQNVSDEVFKAMATVQGPAPENFNLGTNPSTPLIPAPAKADDDVAPIKPSDKKPETPTPEKKPVALGRHEGNGRIADKNHGFSIIPPKGWELKADANIPGPVQPFMFFLGPKDEVTPHISVIDVPNDGTPLEDLGAQLKKVYSASNRTILGDGFVTIDGKKSYWIAQTGASPVNGKNIATSVVQYYVYGNNNHAIIMTFTASPRAFEALRKPMEESAQSAQVD